MGSFVNVEMDSLFIDVMFKEDVVMFEQQL